MAGLNKVMLIGNLGRDPEIRTLESGVSVATFSIATSETYKDRDGNRQTSTEWHNIVVWRGLAEVAEKYLKKGSQIYVEGKLKTRSWQDKDGNTRYTTEVVADNFTMLGRPSDSSGYNRSQDPGPSEEPYANSSSKTTPEQVNDSGSSETDDLPF